MKEKKGSSLIAIAIIILIVIAIGIVMFILINNNKTNNEKINEGGTSVNQAQTNTTTNAEKNSTTKVDMQYTFKVPGKNIYVNVPNWQEIERGFTQLYILNGQKYVAVTFNINERASSLQQAHDIAFDIFKQTIQDYSYVNSLKITEGKEVTINGIKMYKFIGTFNCALDYFNRNNSYDAYAIGYSFILDDVPCSIIGSVINKGQSQVDINEITDIINYMSNTIRTQR